MSKLAPLSLIAVAGVSGNAFATQYLSMEQAQQTIFPDASSFKPLPLQLDAAQMKQVEKLAGLLRCLARSRCLQRRQIARLCCIR